MDATSLSFKTLHDAAKRVLETPVARDKAILTTIIHEQWIAGKIELARDSSSDLEENKAPRIPSRDERVKIISSDKVRSLGKGNSDVSRRKILHSLCHIESWAIDLSWDIVVRFGNWNAKDMPREFFDDFVDVANDEARHHLLLLKRLEEIGGFYGEFQAHDGLWESALKTSDSLEERLVIEHCVHEARGLDVIPNTIRKFRENGDEESAMLLETIIYPEEISHVKAGLRWFKYLQNDTSDEAEERTVQKFRDIVKKCFYGKLKPPFNDEARAKAGFDTRFYAQ